MSLSGRQTLGGPDLAQIAVVGVLVPVFSDTRCRLVSVTDPSQGWVVCVGLALQVRRKVLGFWQGVVTPQGVLSYMNISPIEVFVTGIKNLDR